MLLAYLLLLTGLTISAVAIYYSVVGLAAIFSAAVIPIIVMGSALEVAKLVCASWLKANWSRAPRLMKIYMTTAVAVLMLITSMGIFGFLSKAHSDQSLVSGDVMAKIAVYDEKIKTAKDNIDANRKALKQMDEAVDQVMGRSTSETGADKAVAIRRNQQKERSRLQSEIAAEQKVVAQINEERAPIAAEVRKVEAEVGPLKYIAAFVYGATDESVLERAVTWVIITIIVVFDPLAVIMLLAAQMTFAWHRKGHDPLEVDEPVYEQDDGPLTEQQVEQITSVAKEELPTGEIIGKTELFPDTKAANDEHTESLSEEQLAHVNALAADARVIDDPDVFEFFRRGKEVARALDNSDPLPPLTADQVTWPFTSEQLDQDAQTDLDLWNKMIMEAEAEVAKTNAYDTIEDRLARGESYIDSAGTELTADIPDMERPGDYVNPPKEDEDNSKKKTYMMKDSQGKTQVKNHE